MVDDLQIPISLLKNAYQNDFSRTDIIPVTEREMYNMFPEIKRFKWVRWNFNTSTKNV